MCLRWNWSKSSPINIWFVLLSSQSKNSDAAKRKSITESELFERPLKGKSNPHKQSSPTRQLNVKHLVEIVSKKREGMTAPEENGAVVIANHATLNIHYWPFAKTSNPLVTEPKFSKWMSSHFQSHWVLSPAVVGHVTRKTRSKTWVPF